MKCATQTDKKNVHRRIRIGVLFAIAVVTLVMGCIYLMKRRNVQIEEEEPAKVLSEEEQLLEFEEYFRKCEDDLQRYVELSMESILREEEYIIVFNEKWYRSCLQQYEEWGWTTILYIDEKFVAEEHKEVEEILNKNKDLRETLELIRDNGAIIAVNQRYLDESIQMTEFMLDIDYAPLLTVDHYDHDQSASLFWSDDKGFEEYGYENIEANWYRFVGLSQEQLEREREKEYVEFEKVFWGNKKEMQNFIESFNECVTEKKEFHILFDSQWYRSELSRTRMSGCFAVLFEDDFFTIGEDDEMEKAFNENIDLIEAIKTIKEKGMITHINIFYEEETIQVVEFWIDTKYTHFITMNNGVENSFIWCDDKDYDRYWCKKVGDNWYMDIKAAPE